MRKRGGATSGQIARALREAGCGDLAVCSAGRTRWRRRGGGRGREGEKGGRDWTAEVVGETLGQGAPYIFTSPNQGRGHRPGADNGLLSPSPSPSSLSFASLSRPGHGPPSTTSPRTQPRPLISPIRTPDRSKSAAPADAPAAAATTLSAPRSTVRSQKA